MSTGSCKFEIGQNADEMGHAALSAASQNEQTNKTKKNCFVFRKHTLVGLEICLVALEVATFLGTEF